jgi:hypothetical protein
VLLVDGMKLRLKRIGIDTHRENIAFLAYDDLTGRALGLHPMDRIEVSANERSLRSAALTRYILEFCDDSNN